MKKSTSTLVIVSLAILIVPQLAFASWWNPFSWNISSYFSYVFYSQTQTDNLPTQNEEISPITLSDPQPTIPDDTTDQKKTVLKENSSENKASIIVPHTLPTTQIVSTSSNLSPVVDIVPQTTTGIDTNLEQENITKENALNVNNIILKDYSSLDVYISSAINVINNSGIKNDVSTEVKSWLIDRESKIKQIVEITKDQLSILQAQPLEYFLTYQISTDPTAPYGAKAPPRTKLRLGRS